MAKEKSARITTKTLIWWIASAAFIAILGLVLGLAVMGVFNAAYAVIRLVWIEGRNAFGSPLYPLIASTLAGIALTLIVVRYGKPTRPMDNMNGAVEKIESDVEGKPVASNRQMRPMRPLSVRVADFLLPFAGGGPVGVAMGLVGFITSGCFWVRRHLLRFCRKHGMLGEKADFAKVQKFVLYAMGVLGGFAGAGIIVNLFGVGMVIPRVEAAPISVEAIGIGALIALAGWLLGMLYLTCAKLARMLWNKAGKAQSVLPLICGIVLGLTMVFLPHAGLPGSDAFSSQLLGEWQGVGSIALFATAILRTVLIAFLLNMGWSGGPFLPLAYCSICLALGISDAFGIDAGVSTAAAVSAILVTFSGQPIMGLAALMCCPAESLPVIVVATIIASIIPRPKSLKGDFARPKKVHK